MARQEIEPELIRRLSGEPQLRFCMDDVDIASNEVADEIDWTTRVSRYNQAGQTQIVQDTVRRTNHELAWLAKYSGQIPERWRTFYQISDDIQEAWLDGIDLPDVYKEAALTHPNHIVCTEVCQGQKLRPDQLALAIVNPAVPDFALPEMVLYQRGKGVSQTEIEEAYRLANELVSRRK